MTMRTKEANVSHVSVLASLLGHFQEELAKEIEGIFETADLSDYIMARKKTKGAASMVNEDIQMWAGFPRQLRFYEPIILMMGKTSQECCGTSILLLLEWLPDHCKEWCTLLAPDSAFGTKEELNYSGWTKKVRNFDIKNTRQADICRCLVDLAVADMVGYLMRMYHPRFVTRETLTKLSALAQHFHRTLEPTFAGHVTLWDHFRKMIRDQWASTFSYISGIGAECHPSELIAAGMALKKEHEQKPYFRCFKWMRLNVQIASNEAISFLQAVPAAVDSAKHKSTKMQLIGILDSALRSITWESAVKISEKVKLITKKAWKWSKSDELEGPAFKLLATIFCHGPKKEYDAEFDGLFKKIAKRLSGAKDAKRDQLLQAVLKLLTGSWGGVRESWWPHRGDSFDFFVESGAERTYNYCPLADGHKSMKARLQAIITAVFPKKTVVNRSAPTLDLYTHIAVQICAHSLSFAWQKMFPVLFSEKQQSPAHCIAGLRALRIICDPESRFWEECGWAEGPRKHPNLTTVEHGMDVEEVKRLCEGKMEALAKIADELIGLGVAGHCTTPLQPSSAFAVTDVDYAPFKYEETMDEEVNFQKELRTTSISRSLDLIASAKQYLVLLHAEDVAARARVHAIIDKWFLHSNVRCRENPAPSERPVLVQERVELPNIGVELYMDVLRCAPVLLPPHVKANLADPETTIARLLVHHDQTLATTASHVLQQLLVSQPTYRAPMLQGLIATAMKYTDADTPSLHTLLSQLCVLLDLWVVQNTQERIHEAAEERGVAGEVVACTSEFLLNLSTLKEIEAFALFNLCHGDPEIRSLAMRVINAASIISPVAFRTTLAHLLRFRGAEIIQIARYRYLLDASFGVVTNVKILDHCPLPTIVEAAATCNALFWAYVIGDLARFGVQNGVNAQLARHLVLERLKQLSGTAAAHAGGECAPHMMAVRNNFHNLLFAVAESTPGEEKDAYVQEQLEEYLVCKNGPAAYFNNLVQDVEWLSEEVAMAMGCTHPLAVGLVLRWFIGWYHALNKKVKGKARAEVLRVLRHMVQEITFEEAIRQDPAICQEVAGLLDHIREGLEKGERHGQEAVFVDFALAAASFAKAQYRHRVPTVHGPVRVYLAPSVSQHWEVESRSGVVKLLIQWGQMTQGQIAGEIGKALNHIKDPERKKQRRAELEVLYEAIGISAREAFASLCCIGPLFEAKERRIQTDVIMWARQCEAEGKRVLRWILSFHWVEAIERFVNATYGIGVEPHEQTYFVNAIFDQFIEMCDPPAPRTGVVAHVDRFYERIQQMEAQVPTIEGGALSNEDLALCDALHANAGSIIFVTFYAMMHQLPELRSRAFAMMQRLVPAKFGVAKQYEETASLVTIEEALQQFQSVFTAQILSAARLNALAVSNIAAKACPMHTEAVLREAFKRTPKLLSENGKRWVLEFLHGWVSNVVLHRKDLSDFTPDTLLEHVFGHFTTEILKQDLTLPNELVVFWQKLAQADPMNHDLVVNFLLRTGIQSSYNMFVCKSVLVNLYRGDRPASVEPLVLKLSFAGVSKNMDPLPDDDPSVKPADSERLDEAMQLRDAAITTLRELAIETLQPVLPFLHVILTWSLLRINSPAERENVSHLLMNVVEAVMNLLAKIGGSTSSILPALCQWSNELYTARVRLAWNYSAYQVESLPKGTSILTSQARVIYRSGPAFVRDMVVALRMLGAHEIIARWGQEALDWGLFFKDYQMSITGLEIYKEILANADPDHVPVIYARLLKSVDAVQTSVDRLGVVESREQKRMKKKDQEEPNHRAIIPLARGHARELLQILTKTVGVAAQQKDKHALQLMFWAAVSFLRTTDLAFQPLVFESLCMCTELVGHNFFELISSEADYVEMENKLSSSPGWFFKGLLPLIIQGLYSQHTELVAGRLLSQLVTRAQHPLIHTNHESVLPVAVVGMVPWLAAKLSVLDGSLDSVVEVCHAVLASLASSVFSGTAVEESLRDVVAGTFNGKPMQFLEKVAMEIGTVCLPTFAQDLSEVLAVTVRSAISESFVIPILLITEKFLLLDRAIEYVDSFIDVVRYCSSGFGSNLTLPSQVLLRTNELALKKTKLPTVASPIQPLKSIKVYNSERYELSAVSELIDSAILERKHQARKEVESIKIDFASADTLNDQTLFLIANPFESPVSSPATTGEFALPTSPATAVPVASPTRSPAEAKAAQEKKKKAMAAILMSEAPAVPEDDDVPGDMELPAVPEDEDQTKLETASESEMLDFLEGISGKDNEKQRAKEQALVREREEAERLRMAEAERQRREERRRSMMEAEEARLGPEAYKQKVAEEQERVAMEKKKERQLKASKGSAARLMRHPPPVDTAPTPPPATSSSSGEFRLSQMQPSAPISEGPVEADGQYDPGQTLVLRMAMLERDDLDDAEMEKLAAELGIDVDAAVGEPTDGSGSEGEGDGGEHEEDEDEEDEIPGSLELGDESDDEIPGDLELDDDDDDEGVAALEAQLKALANDELDDEELERLAGGMAEEGESDEDAEAGDSSDDEELERKIAMLESGALTDEQLEKLASELGVEEQEKQEKQEETGAAVVPAAAPDASEELDEEAELERKLELLQSGTLSEAELKKLAAELGLESDGEEDEDEDRTASVDLSDHEEGESQELKKQLAEELELERKMAALENDELDDEELAKLAAELGVGVDDDDEEEVAAPAVEDVKTDDGHGDEEEAAEDEELQRKLALLDGDELDDDELAKLAAELGINVEDAYEDVEEEDEDDDYDEEDEELMNEVEAQLAAIADEDPSEAEMREQLRKMEELELADDDAAAPADLDADLSALESQLADMGIDV